MHSEQQLVWLKKTELMFKLFPGLLGHLRQLIMHFGSGRDAYFIVAMAVPVLEFALLFVIDFPCIVCYFFSGNFSLKEENSFTEESFSCNVYNCCLHLPYFWYFYHNRIFHKNYLTLNSYTNTARSSLPTNPSRWCWKLQ